MQQIILFLFTYRLDEIKHGPNSMQRSVQIIVTQLKTENMPFSGDSSNINMHLQGYKPSKHSRWCYYVWDRKEEDRHFRCNEQFLI
jgi:hypothetical protein